MNTAPVSFRVRLIRLVPATAIILAILLTIYLVIQLHDWLNEDTGPQKKIVQKITLIKPPPIKKPPPEEKPPEPEVKNEIKQEPTHKDQPQPSEPPPSADLGVDGEGTGAGDGFGLIGKKGGSGLLDGSPYAWYEGLMVSEIQDALSNIDELKSDEYNVRVRLQLGIDGSVKKVVLLQSTGDKKKDQLLISALDRFGKFSRMPPVKMPPIVTLKITSTI